MCFFTSQILSSQLFAQFFSSSLHFSNISILKGAQDTLGSTVFSFCRFGVAALAFSPALPAALRTPSLAAAAAELGVIAAGGYALQNLALMSSNASSVSFLSSFTVILVPLLESFQVRPIRPDLRSSDLIPIRSPH